MKKNLVKMAFLSLLLLACNKNKTVESLVVGPDELHGSVDKVTEIMVHDIFSPPVASRVFVYPNIAAYEIIALHNEKYLSLEGKVKGLTTIPRPETSSPVNYQLAAVVAHIELSKKLIFSEYKMDVLRDSLYAVWENQDESSFKASKRYGLKVADHIGKWMKKDNYDQTRTMSKFTVDTDNAKRWQPTPPAYIEGIEPHWDKIRPFVIDSAQQFKPVPPPEFSLKEGSEFYNELKEVYDTGNDITKKGDESEEIKIAKFWDCNPFVSVTKGHLMFATKKISPGAHWIGITKIASRSTKSDFDATVYAYTKTSIAIADAFISCWAEKYRSNLIRPETLINSHMDAEWKPVLQTPPFPEYTSGHSVVSGAAATVLTGIFGDNFSFDDDTEVAYGLPIRSFSSFNEAAGEAAISRLYGGIHYRAAVEVGLEQGQNLGKFINENLNMMKDKHTVLNQTERDL